MGGGSPRPTESQEQIQQRQRAQAENIRAIQEGVTDRSAANFRRFNPRSSLISGAVRRPIS